MRTQKVSFLFSFFLIAVVIATATATVELAPPPEPLLGGYSPIKNLTDPHVQEVALFAVEEYNKKQDKVPNKLQFLSILQGWSQVVAGLNYRLIITATPLRGSFAAHRYEVEVYERPWQHFRNLTSFKLIDK